MNQKELFSNSGIRRNTKCGICGEKAIDILKQYGDSAIEEGSFSEKLGKWICYPCRESEESMPQGTILFFNPANKTVEKYIIMTHEDLYDKIEIEDPSELENLHFEPCENVECPIQFEYIHTDAWRGYYQPKNENWKTLHSDCILAYSEDEQELKKFDIDIKQILWNLGYEFAIAFGTTSNLFSCGYDILIKKEQEQDIIKQMALYSKLLELRQKYRDSERFNINALTGSNEKTRESLLLVEAYKRLQKGEDFETVKQDILKKVKP